MPYQLHYFTLRLWLEELGNEQAEWRGELKNAKTGEIRYFRQGPMLLQQLTALLAEETTYGDGSQAHNISSEALPEDSE